MLEIQTAPNIPNPVVQSMPTDDRIGKNKTVYDVSTFEIFWRNMIAGMGRAFGNILLYFIFIFVMGYIFSLLVWPSLQPMVNSYMKLVNSLDSIQNMQSGNSLNTSEIENLLNSYGVGR